MKKYLLTFTALMTVSTAYALDCSVRPSCSDLGYTKSAADCEGLDTLKCPFDLTQVFCKDADKSVTCAVGSILYNDLKCYTTPPSGKTAIAVVFDATNRLAIGLKDAPYTMHWSSVSEDISGLTNYTSSTNALAETTTGKQNTATIIALGGDYASSSYAPGYCYNLTEGGLSQGSWFLPNFKELKAIYDNKTVINTALTTAGGSSLTASYYWSSTEYDALYSLLLHMGNGDMYSNYKLNDRYVRCGLAF